MSQSLKYYLGPTPQWTLHRANSFRLHLSFKMLSKMRATLFILGAATLANAAGMNFLGIDAEGKNG